MTAYIVDYIRTPFGRYGGALANIRTDNLAALPLSALLARNAWLEPSRIGEVAMGCANQAGEDNRNVARMAMLLAGLPASVPALTVNRLCGSGLDAVAAMARAVASGDIDIALAGGVESMSRAPFVIPKATQSYARAAEIYDTTIGWRFVNPLIEGQYGADSMPETAENVAAQFGIARADQDAFALQSQQRAGVAQASGRLSAEILAVEVPGHKGQMKRVEADEHPRLTTLEQLAKLPAPFRAGGTVTAGNASGLNDGAAALLIVSDAVVNREKIKPLARIAGFASAGVEPRIMGFGPVPAVQKLIRRTGTRLADLGVIELNEAFAAQALAVLRALSIADDDRRVNPNGGAIALGHPLGASGARLVLTLMLELEHRQLRTGLASMCIGVGQGIAVVLERV